MTAVGHAQVLWQNLSVGMSPEEVAKAQPEAIRPPKPDTLHGGAICELALEKIDVANSDYKACFFFKDRKLIQVTQNALRTPYEGEFQSVVTLLRAKYGPELSLTRGVLGFSADCKLASGVNVAVIFLNKYGNLLNINYQVRLASDTSNL